jgi:HSP20 family protein
MKLIARNRLPIATIRDEFDRLFDQFPTGLFGPPAPSLETMWNPSLDFSENEKEFIVRLEVPGIPKDDLEITVDGRTLTLSGRRAFEQEEKTEEYFWRERQQGRFVRTVQLPGAVNAANVAATYVDGVMSVRLPKAEPTVKSRIPIK